jgi:hypothetical protein
MPQNGGSALTEGARLRKLTERKPTECTPAFIPRQGNTDECIYKQSIQYPITQTENSRIAYQYMSTIGHAFNGSGVTQERAREVLSSFKTRQFGSGTVLTKTIQQDTIAESEDTVPKGPIISVTCPPLPAPPGPPMRQCILTKDLKLGS